MKNYPSRSLLLFLFLAVYAVAFGQSLDTAVVTAASELYKPKRLKTDTTVKISADAPLDLFRKADNKTRFVEANAAKSTVVDIQSILTTTGNTPYAGKFVRENGGTMITCFIDKQGVRHDINVKRPASVGTSGNVLSTNDPNSDFKGSFCKEQNKPYITCYVDAFGVRHAIGADLSLYLPTATAAATYATKTALNSEIATRTSQVANLFQNIDELEQRENNLIGAKLDTSAAKLKYATIDNINYVQSQINGVNANWGNVAYVSKNGDNATAQIGNRALPYRDPVAARKAIEAAGFNNALIEVYPATYLVTDTDTATFQMNAASITPDVFVLFNSSQAQNKANCTLSAQTVSSISYYFHAGTRFITKRFNDSFPTPMFFDTLGKTTNVYGRGAFEDYGTYFKNSTLNSGRTNNNYNYSAGRIFELKRETTHNIECEQIYALRSIIHHYGGTRTSTDLGADSAGTTIWADSLRNFNFKSLKITCSKMTSESLFGINSGSTSVSISDRTGLTTGVVDIRCSDTMYFTAQYTRLYSLTNYDITIQSRTYKGSGILPYGLKNTKLLIDFDKQSNTGGLPLSIYADMSNSTVTYRCKQMETTTGFYTKWINAKTRNFKLFIEVPQCVLYNSGLAATHEGNAFLITGAFEDTANVYTIRNTNFSNITPNGTTIAALNIYGHTDALFGGAKAKLPRIVVQNSSFYSISLQSPFANYLRTDANISAANCNVITQNVTHYGIVPTATNTGTISTVVNTPTYNNAYRPY